MNSQIAQNKNGQINIVLSHKQNKNESIRRHNRSYHENGPFHHIYKHFASFIGMDSLKTTISEIYATHIMNEKRKEVGMKGTNQVLHMFFKGNPGTGKTTVARKLAALYFQMNILSKGHFVEAERADLVGEYIGQTAQKTRALIQKSKGGILFIDEAYSLARGGEKDFGKEAIDTLVTHMEDNSDDLVIILAGYPYEMERFLRLNPGLKSRFPFILDFDDYDARELLRIAKQMVRLREYELTKEAEEKLRHHLEQKVCEGEHNFSNARYIRNVIERSIRRHSVRLLCHNTYAITDLMHIHAEDLHLMNE